jgi:hypothetical protein
MKPLESGAFQHFSPPKFRVLSRVPTPRFCSVFLRRIPRISVGGDSVNPQPIRRHAVAQGLDGSQSNSIETSYVPAEVKCRSRYVVLLNRARNDIGGRGEIRSPKYLRLCDTARMIPMERILHAHVEDHLCAAAIFATVRLIAYQTLATAVRHLS